MFDELQVERCLPLILKKGTNRIGAFCWLFDRRGYNTKLVHCWIDTGAQDTIIPEKHWRELFPYGVGPADDWIEGIGGARIPAKRFVLKLEVIPGSRVAGQQGVVFEKCPVRLAMVSQLNSPKGVEDVPVVLLGLGSLLQMGGMCINARTEEAHLVVLKT